MKNRLIVLSHIIKEKIFKLIWYNWSRKAFNITAVAVVDGRLYSGGFADRMKGIVSLYAWAKMRNIPFKISYSFPFQLTDYLTPNIVDWTIKEGDYVKTYSAADIIYAVSEPTVIKRLNIIGNKRQIHFYGNRDLLSSMGISLEKWGEYYNELFKPADNLKNTLEAVRNIIGDNYFSVVFRFQNLLGDFPEYNFKPLDSVQEKEDLIRTCINKVEELKVHESGRTCLVTSDSVSFLEIASKLEGVKIIPGEMVHLGSNDSGTYKQYEKSFVDFYILSESTGIYSVVSGSMYPSEFPLYAARVNNIPFQRIFVK